MSAPIIKLISQSRYDRVISIRFLVTGAPTSVTVELPAAAIPNGAVSQAARTITPDAAGEYKADFAALPYGDYAKGIIKATNAAGEERTVTTWDMRLFVPGAAAPGTPRAFLPPFVAPNFTTPSIPIGAVVAPVRLKNTSTTLQGGGPFTFGQPFKRGELKPGDFLVGKVSGNPDIALQFNVKATHQDGSVRHAIISGIAPVLAPNAELVVNMVRAASGTSTTPFAPSVAANAPGFSAVVDIVIDGVAYRASANPALLAGVAPNKVWVGGAIASEFILDLPFVAADGAAHPLLTMQFAVRHFPGVNKTRVDVALESTKAYAAIVDVAYTGTITIGGINKYTISAWENPAAPLVHYPAARWKKTFWHNNDNPVFARLDVDYLIDSKAVPNYDRRIKAINPAKLQEYRDHLAGISTSPMNFARFQRAMPTQGGRPDIGLAPDCYAASVLTMDKDAYDMMLASANAAGTWSTHRRDDSAGPAAGQVIDIIHWPRCTILGTTSDSLNKATGRTEKFPGATTASPGEPDNSHQAGFAYIPYLVTGDFYYLEELIFWNNYCLNMLNPGFRSSETGYYWSGQPRAQAWTTRTLVEIAAIAPDDHVQKQTFQFWLDNNLTGLLARYGENPNANSLGIIIDGPNALVYDGTLEDNIGFSNWQDDFYAMALGHGAELGFEKALRMLRWKAKFQVGRLLAPGTCWIHASEYFYIVRNSETSPLYGTIAECQEATAGPELWALPCNSPERLAKYIELTGNNKYVINEMIGRSGNTDGYPTLLGAALAFCVDANSIPDSDLAWDLFETRTPKPDYSNSPQFAIVPRDVALAELPPPDPNPEPGPEPEEPAPPLPAPPDTYAAIVGSTMFFGRN